MLTKVLLQIYLLEGLTNVIDSAEYGNNAHYVLWSNVIIFYLDNPSSYYGPSENSDGAESGDMHILISSCSYRNFSPVGFSSYLPVGYHRRIYGRMPLTTLSQ